MPLENLCLSLLSVALQAARLVARLPRMSSRQILVKVKRFGAKHRLVYDLFATRTVYRGFLIYTVSSRLLPKMDRSFNGARLPELSMQAEDHFACISFKILKK